MKPEKEKKTCPKCNTNEHVVPIVYGYPSEEMEAYAKENKIAFGGCCVSPFEPNWHCERCDSDFL